MATPASSPTATARPSHAPAPPVTVVDDGDCSGDVLALNLAALCALASRIARRLERARAGSAEFDVLQLRANDVAAELTLRELSVAPGRMAVWAV